GNPYGQRDTATFGTVSGLNRTESESPDGPAAILTGMVQTSAPIAPGNSGGALVNMRGQLIGIPTLGATTQQTGTSGATTTVGFAIPSNEVNSVARQLIQTGHVTTTTEGFLGVQGQDVTAQLASADGLSAQSGVLIAGFANDAAGTSPARAGGLRSSDVIVAVDGQSVTDSNDLAAAVASQAPGKAVTVTVARGSGQVTLDVTLGQRPANA
ncbi:MAG: S1C family serine protease, partial [Ktedonobacterales bacterium]